MKKQLLTMCVVLLAGTFLMLSSCKKDKTPPKPEANFTFASDFMKAPAEISFTNSSKDATSYSWDFGDGNTSTEKSPKHTFTAKGSYDVKLTATNEDGLTSTKTKNIKVYGNITSWSPLKVELRKSAWVGEDENITIYMSVWNSNNTNFNYTGDGTYVSYSNFYDSEKLTFTFINKMTLGMTSTSKVTIKFQLYDGFGTVNPNIDPIVYQITLNGSDVLPSNAQGPYIPYFTSTDEKFYTTIEWKD